MDPASPHPQRDPEFDPGPRRERPARLPPDLRPYQRLVVNPFLALVGGVAWVVALRAGLASGWVRPGAAFLLSVFALIGLFHLVHYHCRDCGTTGPFPNWIDHACAAVLRRVAEGRPRRLHGPSPPVQLLLWAYLLLSLLIVLTVTGGVPVRRIVGLLGG